MKNDLEPWQRLIKNTGARLQASGGDRRYQPFIETCQDLPGHTFLLFPLRFEEDRKGREKCEVPAICAHIEGEEGAPRIRLLVEDKERSELFTLAPLRDLAAAETLLDALATEVLAKVVPGAPSRSEEAAALVQSMLEHANHRFERKGIPVPRYDQPRDDRPVDESNLKDIAWLKEAFAGRLGQRVDRGDESLVRVRFGGEAFELLRADDLWLVMNNVPTLRLLEQAVVEGLVPSSLLEDYVSIEAEREGHQKTLQQYQEKGVQVGEQKDYRADNFWRDAPPMFAYDPVRGLYYLTVAREPVMDEFARPFIELTGDIVSRRGGAVLEIGFGMGISAGAVQERLKRARASFPDEPVAHIIIEYNREISALARQWGARQSVPVIVLDGDWNSEIQHIPDGVLSGALSDPYPLSPAEKHKDAALALREIHRCLRPGGVSVHYADSQYNLFEEHYEIALGAGFRTFSGLTSSFGNHLATGEQYTLGLRMLIPVLHKQSLLEGKEAVDLDLSADEKRALLGKIFAETSSWARRGAFSKGLWGA